MEVRTSFSHIEICKEDLDINGVEQPRNDHGVNRDPICICERRNRAAKGAADEHKFAEGLEGELDVTSLVVVIVRRKARRSNKVVGAKEKRVSDINARDGFRRLIRVADHERKKWREKNQGSDTM